MATEQQDYNGHRIEIRSSASRDIGAAGATPKPGRELTIDGKPVGYGQLPDGSYALHEYAYDWSHDLMDLARRFIDHREKTDRIRRDAAARGEK